MTLRKKMIRLPSHPDTCPNPLPESAGTGIAGKEEVLGEDPGELTAKPTCNGAPKTKQRSIDTGPQGQDQDNEKHAGHKDGDCGCAS